MKLVNQEVKLWGHFGNDNSIANVARGSMKKGGNYLELPDGYTVEQRDKLLKYLADHKHTTPFRHTSITLQCKGPLFIARQLGKHQVGMSWNELSRRYVDKDFEFLDMSQTWRVRAAHVKQGSAGLALDTVQAHCKKKYEDTIHSALTTYNELLETGIAPEQARAVLPASLMVDYIWTGSLTAFAHVYTLRKHASAQKEAQEFAESLNIIIKQLFPVSWKALTETDK